MSDRVYRATEVVGTSKESLADAIDGAVSRTSATVRDLDWFEVTQIRGHIRDGEVDHFQVSLKIGFRVEA